MGADLMVVPLGYESGAEGILIKGEPSYFYFDKSVLEEIKAADIDGNGTINTLDLLHIKKAVIDGTNISQNR
jgi:putative ABC transport system permease protein